MKYHIQKQILIGGDTEGWRTMSGNIADFEHAWLLYIAYCAVLENSRYQFIKEDDDGVFYIISKHSNKIL